MVTDNHGGRCPKIVSYEQYLEKARAERQAEPAAAASDLPSENDPHRHAFEFEYYRECYRRHATFSAVPAIAATGVAAADGVNAAAQPAGPPTEVTDELTSHNYDGIQEYDNPTPGWWYMLFGVTIVLSVLYVGIYHSPLVPTQPERHARAEAASLERQFAELNTLEMGEPKILAIMQKEEWLSKGASIFRAECNRCHADDGSGLVGPNLTDEKYNNIATLTGMARLIAEGTPNGSMPPQKIALNNNEIALVTAYVASLRGKNLPTPESVQSEYEGVPIPPWPTIGGTAPVSFSE